MSPVPPGRERPQILHICTRYVRGGSERRIRDIVVAADHCEHMLVVGAGSDIERAQANIPGVVVRVEPHLVREVRILADARALLALIRLVRRERCDLVVTHQSKAGVVGRVAALLARVPVVHSLSMASFGPGYGRHSSRLFAFVERVLGSATFGFAVVGEDLKHRYTALGLDSERFRVVRSGVDLCIVSSRTDAKTVVHARLAISGCRPLVVVVGSLEPRKGVGLIPEFWRAVIDQSTDARRPFLAIAGDGPLRVELEQGLQTAGLMSDCAVLGYVTPVIDLIQAADVIVLLSNAEGLPQVLVQAAAAGTPFVSFDVDGVDELLRLGAAGRVVPLGDIDGVVRAVQHVLACGRRGSPVDTASWSDAEIRRGHRKMIDSALGAR